MSTNALEKRLGELEREVARLRAQVESKNGSSANWVTRMQGAFENDPMFEEAMKLGRAYRKSLDRKKRPARSGEKETWGDRVAGAFADDPLFEKAVRLGAAYRRSLRPAPAGRKKRK